MHHILSKLSTYITYKPVNLLCGLSAIRRIDWKILRLSSLIMCYSKDNLPNSGYRKSSH
jgi:hypothetical protein